MKIYNTTTGKIETLLISNEYGVECTYELLFYSGVNLIYNEKFDAYELTDEEISWWRKIINGLDAIDERLEEAEAVLTPERFECLENEIARYGNEYDWEDHIRRVNEILDEYLDV